MRYTKKERLRRGSLLRLAIMRLGKMLSEVNVRNVKNIFAKIALRFRLFALVCAYHTQIRIGLYTIYDVSGLHWLVAKIVPRWSRQDPSTAVVWLIGFYLATFTFASGLHESRKASLERRVSSLSLQLRSGDKTAALGRVASLQQSTIPPRPKFIRFENFLESIASPFFSLYAEEQDPEIVQDLKDLIEVYKGHLKGADLTGVDLSGANLKGAQLQNAILLEADLTGANLSGAIAESASFEAANLVGADLSNAQLQDASLIFADLSNAKLTFANLKRTSLFNTISSVSTDWVGAAVSSAYRNDFPLLGCFSEANINADREMFPEANINGDSDMGESSDEQLYVTENFSDCYLPEIIFTVGLADFDHVKYSFELRRLVHLLRAWPQITLVIGGNTHEMGSREYLIALGERLARIVMRHFYLQGIKGNQLAAVSFASERPVDLSQSKVRHVRNNRVTFELEY